jgi:hypothetical protein
MILFFAVKNTSSPALEVLLSKSFKCPMSALQGAPSNAAAWKHVASDLCSWDTCNAFLKDWKATNNRRYDM